METPTTQPLQATRTLLDVDIQETDALKKKLADLKGRMQLTQFYYNNTKGHSYMRDHHVKKLAEDIAAAEAEVASVAKMPSWRDALINRRRLQQSTSLSSDPLR